MSARAAVVGYARLPLPRAQRPAGSGCAQGPGSVVTALQFSRGNQARSCALEGRWA